MGCLGSTRTRKIHLKHLSISFLLSVSCSLQFFFSNPVIFASCSFFILWSHIFWKSLPARPLLKKYYRIQNNIFQLGTNRFIYAFLHSLQAKSDLALHLMFLKDKQGIIKKSSSLGISQMHLGEYDNSSYFCTSKSRLYLHYTLLKVF